MSTKFSTKIFDFLIAWVYNEIAIETSMYNCTDKTVERIY